MQGPRRDESSASSSGRARVAASDSRAANRRTPALRPSAGPREPREGCASRTSYASLGAPFELECLRQPARIERVLGQREALVEGLRRPCPRRSCAPRSARARRRRRRRSRGAARRNRARARHDTPRCSSRTPFARAAPRLPPYDAFGARGLIEERSFAAGKAGREVFDERFSLAEDSLDPPRAAEGIRLRRHPQGARRARRERRASRGSLGPADGRREAGDGRQSTGNAPPASAKQVGPDPVCALDRRRRRGASTRSSPSSSATGSTSRGCTTSSIVNPREGVITGMTRDGTFRAPRRQDRRPAR